MDEMQMPRSKFLKITCKKCKSDQVVFNKATTLVKCLKCNANLVIPTGGVSEIVGKVVQEL